MDGAAWNPDELRRCIRDLVALSTLPAAWQKYDMRQIGDSIVAALISMLDADFVFVMHFPASGDQFITELARSSPRYPKASNACRQCCSVKAQRSAADRNLSWPTHPAAATST